MVCPKCGKENAETMKFCSQCGSSLTENEQEIISEQSESKGATVVGESISSTAAHTKPKNSIDENVKRSKIYSYFYGSNTVFQQFIIILGVFCLMMINVANVAQYAKYDSMQEKYYELREEASIAESEYEELYYEYRYDFDVDRYEAVSVTKGEKDYDEKVEYNKALEEYEKANEKCEKYSEKMENAHSSTPFMASVFKFLGYIAILIGIVWFVYKKITFDKSGEYVYDQELKDKIEEAKQKGMDKLNIISEQIEKVEPVVLNGIAHVDDDLVSAISIGKLGALFQTLFKFILSFDKIIVGLIGSSILTAISTFLVSKNVPFIIVFLLVFGGIGYLGYLAYKKYEIDSYIKPKTIERLNKFAPHYVERVGSDDRLRVSLPAITVYMFGDDQLYMYYQYLDIVTGKIFCEGVHEYFYEDIVGITSAQETKKTYKRYGFMNLFLRSIDYLKEHITVVSSGCMHKESYVVDIGHSLLDTQFVGMRNLIRQKKMEK